MGFLSDMTLDLKNRIDRKVVKTLMGYYGNGEERKRRLGDDYHEVQSKVEAIILYFDCFR